MNNFQCIKSALLGEESFTLKHESSLTVTVTQKPFQTAYAVLAVGYGSLDTVFTTDDGRTHKTPAGIAHFLEHKLFEMPNGTDAFEEFAALGASANAYTSASRTCYLFSCTSNFEESLEVLLRMVFTPHFTDASVRREADIIEQEFLAYEDQAPSKLYRLLMNNLFEKHGLRENICGTAESIRKITPELLYECYRAFYRPSNMVLSVSGNVSPDTVKKVLDRVLPTLSIENGEAAKSEKVDERGAVACTESRLSMLIARPILQIGIKDVGYREDQIFMTRRHLLMNIVMNALTGASSPLYERLQDCGLLQDKFSTDYGDEAGCAYALIAAETDEPDRVIESVYEALEKAAETPPDQREFERLRRCAYADFVRLFDSSEEIAEEMLDNFFTGVHLLDVGEIILSLTYEEFTSLIKEVFRRPYLTSAVVYPLQENR